MSSLWMFFIVLILFTPLDDYWIIVICLYVKIFKVLSQLVESVLFILHALVLT